MKILGFGLWAVGLIQLIPELLSGDCTSSSLLKYLLLFLIGFKLMAKD